MKKREVLCPFNSTCDENLMPDTEVDCNVEACDDGECSHTHLSLTDILPWVLILLQTTSSWLEAAQAPSMAVALMDSLLLMVLTISAVRHLIASQLVSASSLNLAAAWMVLTLLLDLSNMAALNSHAM